ncbi:hypothetical protein ABZ611_09175 [Streptomyces sp. NPDC007861]|uniref:hypothetical protein n=1 Tax=Streptomyces sp. NPDC007861 TaxID=3154893 RepID=UPI0033C36D8B
MFFGDVVVDPSWTFELAEVLRDCWYEEDEQDLTFPAALGQLESWLNGSRDFEKRHRYYWQVAMADFDFGVNRLGPGYRQGLDIHLKAWPCVPFRDTPCGTTPSSTASANSRLSAANVVLKHAPDLADQITEGQLTVDEAIHAPNERQEEERLRWHVQDTDAASPTTTPTHPSRSSSNGAISPGSTITNAPRRFAPTGTMPSAASSKPSRTSRRTGPRSRTLQPAPAPATRRRSSTASPPRTAPSSRN